jgi:hypothetical protein
VSLFTGLLSFLLIPIPYSSRPEKFQGELVRKSTRNFMMFWLMYPNSFFRENIDAEI